MEHAFIKPRNAAIIKYSIWFGCITSLALSILFIERYVSAKSAPIENTKITTSQTLVKVKKQDETIRTVNALDRQFLLAMLTLIVFFVLSALLMVRVYLFTPTRLWAASCAISLGLVFAIGFLWRKAFIELNLFVHSSTEKNLVDHKKIIEQFKNDSMIKQSEHLSSKNYIFVPTGIYIQDLSIKLDRISFIGYVWQKYPINAFGDIKPGIIFPQSIISHIKKTYEFADENWHTIGWSAQCTLDQNFNFNDYPFDAQKIEIQLWPSDFDSAIVLVPDLTSYRSFDLTALPGLNSGIKIEDWHLEESYFDYEKENFKTTFGYNSDATQRSLPELKFNIVINRSLYSSFILNIISILIILILLFIVLLMIQWAGFYSVLASIASLFFIALFAYSSFRSAFKSQQIVFFDYVYFILESIILIISILSIIYYKNVPITWITYNHMSIPRLIFWPITMLSICMVSIIFFF